MAITSNQVTDLRGTPVLDRHDEPTVERAGELPESEERRLHSHDGAPAGSTRT